MKTYVFIFLALFSFNAKAALDESVCATLVTTELKALNSEILEPRLIPYWTAICKGILNHIKAAAVVNNTGSCTVASGSSAGGWPTTSTGNIQ